MSKKIQDTPTVPETPQSQSIDIAAIVKAAIEASKTDHSALAEAITEGINKTQRRRQTIADVGEPKTPFNPEGKKRVLEHEFLQNGFPIKERFVSDQEIELLHQLTPGKYGPADWPIVVIETKNLDGTKRINIAYNEGKNDRFRMKNYSAEKGRSANLCGFLQTLVEEAKEQKAKKKADARALLTEDSE